MVLGLHYAGKVNKNNPMAEETSELVSSVTKFYSFFTVQRYYKKVEYRRMK